jgi:hypothetical protein
MSKSANYALRLPSSLKRAAEETARADGTTLNQFITSAVAEKLSALKTAEFFLQKADGTDREAFRRILRRDGGQLPDQRDVLPLDLAERLSKTVAL